MFGALPVPDMELYMYVSNSSLAVLDPGSNAFLQQKFDSAEENLIYLDESSNNVFFINLREHLCMALVLWTCLTSRGRRSDASR